MAVAELVGVGCDLETFGDPFEYALQPWRRLEEKAGIRAVTCGDVSLFDPTKDQLETILSPYADTPLYVIGWNIPFDIAWLIAEGLEDLCLRIKWVDAMLLWRHWVVQPESELSKAKRKSFSLEAALKEFYPEAAGIKGFTDFNTQDPEQLKKLMERNSGDANYTYRLAKDFWEKLTPEQRNCALIEARCLPLVAGATVRGLAVDSQQTSKLREELKATIIKDYRELIKVSPGNP